MAEELSYSKAMEELERIVMEIEDDSIDVDELAKKIKRASDLLNLCNQKLKASEADVAKILEKLNEDL